MIGHRIGGSTGGYIYSEGQRNDKNRVKQPRKRQKGVCRGMEGLLAALEDSELSGWIMRAKRAGEANRGENLRLTFCCATTSTEYDIHYPTGKRTQSSKFYTPFLPTGDSRTHCVIIVGPGMRLEPCSHPFCPYRQLYY